MGTTWSVRWLPRGPGDEPAVLRLIENTLDLVVGQMSPWRADSDISRFNCTAPGIWHDLPEAFRTVLSCGLNIARATGGAYDPTAGELVDLWGFGPPGPVASDPDECAVAAALERCGWRRLADDGHGRYRQPGGLRLDLSSIAKGYAVDCIVERLAAHGIAGALVEIGGELCGYGIKPDGQPWWVALDHPAAGTRQHEPRADDVVALYGLGVATSGDAQRRLERGGRVISHTIDPRNGHPVSADVASVSVLNRRCMEADAWATALLVLGREEGPAMAQTRSHRCAIHPARWRLVECDLFAGLRGDAGLLSCAQADRCSGVQAARCTVGWSAHHAWLTPGTRASAGRPFRASCVVCWLIP